MCDKIVPKLDDRYPYDAMIERDKQNPDVHHVVAQDSSAPYFLFTGTYDQCIEWKRLNCICI